MPGVLTPRHVTQSDGRTGTTTCSTTIGYPSETLRWEPKSDEYVVAEAFICGGRLDIRGEEDRGPQAAPDRGAPGGRARAPRRDLGTQVSDSDGRLWHPWLRINRVLREMLHIVAHR